MPPPCVEAEIEVRESRGGSVAPSAGPGQDDEIEQVRLAPIQGAGIAFMQKPFTAADLFAIVARALQAFAQPDGASCAPPRIGMASLRRGDRPLILEGTTPPLLHLKHSDAKPVEAPALEVLRVAVQRACKCSVTCACSGMVLPSTPVTLTPEQIEQLNSLLSNVRHDVNNQLSLVVAAAELLRLKPELHERMTKTILDLPSKITDRIKQFSGEWERVMGITRP
jgi:hypothetical protein